MRTFLLRLSRLIGNSLLYGSIFALITGSIAYAATGTKMLPNFLSSGVDFMSFFSNSGDGTAGIDARSYYTRVNGSWMGYPGDSKNYLRNDTFMSGTLYDENNSAYYVNPNSTSKVNTLYVDGNLYDTDNTGYYLNPASTSNFNVMSGQTLCLDGVCKGDWGSVGLGTIASYASSVAGTYSCSAAGYTYIGIVSGTSMRTQVKVSGTTVCDSGNVAIDNHDMGASCTYAPEPTCWDGGCTPSLSFIATVGCDYGGTGIGCKLTGISNISANCTKLF